MKTSVYRRVRHRAHTSETKNFNNELLQDQSFFGENTYDPFFKNTNGSNAHSVAQLKSSGTFSENTIVQRMEDKKEEELIQKKEENEKKGENIMRKGELQNKKAETIPPGKSSASTAGPPENYIHSLNGKGNSLPKATNTFFSNRMGYDFSDVKVHTGKEAADSAKGFNAKAYTVKNNIVFNENQYNPNTIEGKKLIAHELTHIVRQNPKNKLSRKTIPAEAEKEEAVIPVFFEQGIVEQNTRHFANCNGVRVEGYTDANYSNSFTAPGTSTPVSDCPDCSSDECVVSRGTVISVFNTNPQITLPAVPSGLNECEQNAVRRFINTTLRAHERQHVAAFNTYRGRVRTRYNYRGCASGLDAHLQQIHDNIEAARKANSDAASAALDAGGANIFTVNCNCPDTESESNGK